MTDHPCKDMTPRQIEVFEQIATGNPLPRGTKTMFDALSGRGLIVPIAPLQRRDAMGRYEIPQWEVPIHHHMEWCQWCSENVDDET